jgi:hypothetical protein
MAGLRTLGEIIAYMDSQLGGQQRNGGAQAALVTGAAMAAAATDPPAAEDNSMQDPIRRYTLEAVERRAPGLAPSFLVDGTTVYIMDDGRGIAPALAEPRRWYVRKSRQTPLR